MGTHLRVLSKSYPMNANMTRFRCFSKLFAFFMPWMKVILALKRLRKLIDLKDILSKRIRNLNIDKKP